MKMFHSYNFAAAARFYAVEKGPYVDIDSG